MLPPGDRNCDVRNKCVRLFEQYSGDELQLKIAEATADEWLDMYRYKTFSMNKPKIALKYVSLTSFEKKAFDKDNPDWAESEEMQEYAHKEADAIRTMESNKEFLKDAIHYLESDVPRREKVRGVLAGYSNVKVEVEQSKASWED